MVAAWRLLGSLALVLAILFVSASALPGIFLAGLWRRAYVLAYSAVYGPFVVMATYVLLYVECTHCKTAAWQMLPCGPGIILSEIVRRVAGLSRLDGTMELGVALMLSAAMVAGVTLVLRNVGRLWQVVVGVTVAAFTSFCALVLMALIRA
jgi:hypothetical protein